MAVLDQEKQTHWLINKWTKWYWQNLFVLKRPKYEYLTKKHENAGIKHLNNPNAFIECSNTIDDVYENIDYYNPSRRRKILIVFDDMIADIMTNKKFQTIIK